MEEIPEEKKKKKNRSIYIVLTLATILSVSGTSKESKSLGLWAKSRCENKWHSVSCMSNIEGCLCKTNNRLFIKTQWNSLKLDVTVVILDASLCQVHVLCSNWPCAFTCLYRWLPYLQSTQNRGLPRSLGCFWTPLPSLGILPPGWTWITSRLRSGRGAWCATGPGPHYPGLQAQLQGRAVEQHSSPRVLAPVDTGMGADAWPSATSAWKWGMGWLWAWWWGGTPAS